MAAVNAEQIRQATMALGHQAGHLFSTSLVPHHPTIPYNTDS